MKHRIVLFAAVAALLTATTAWAQAPVITGVSPQPVPANLNTSITLSGSGFGAPNDSVYFPGQTWGFAPSSWGSGWCTVPVPPTWSGTIQVRSGSTGLTSNNFPFEVTYSWHGTAWPMGGSSFTWFLNQNGAPGVPINDVVEALTTAYEVWMCASGITMTYGGTTAMTGFNHTDGNNVQYWSTSPWADPNIIAVTTWRWNGSLQIVEADVHYNGADWTWATDGSAGNVDIHNVAAHEDGHSLGFLDLYGVADQDKTMYGWSGNGDTQGRVLHLRDVEGAEFVYPRTGRPNMREGTPTGWWGPVVPNDNTVVETSVPLPAVLPGNLPMYVNFAVTNTGMDCASPISFLVVYLDEVYDGQGAWGSAPFVPGHFVKWTNRPTTVRSGRHTFTVHHDVGDDIVESDETDNIYRAQFAWTPWGLADQNSVVRPAPPDPGPLAVSNCEGFQFTGNWWGGVAIVPQNAADDYDIDLFNDYSGSTQGYQTALAASTVGAGRTDFVIVNGNVEGFGETRWAGVRRYDASVGSDVVVSQSNQVGSLLSPGTGYATADTSDVVTIGSNQLLKIHEVELTDPGTTYTITLDNLTGTADLHLALYDATESYGRRGYALVASETYAAGGDETIQYQPPASGYFGVAVYKHGSADAALTNTYRLSAGPSLANLNAGVTPPNWSSPIVPRNTADADPLTSVALPTTFNAPGSVVYLNWSVEQEGPNCSPPMTTQVWYDIDYLVSSQIWPGVTSHCPGPWWSSNTVGFTSDGGRHAVRVVADAGDAVAETTEDDNMWVGQWVWPPRATVKNTPLLRPLPPKPGVLFPNPNCDGFSFTRTPGTAWVVGVLPLGPSDDYDLVVYDDYTDSQNGFSNARGSSGELVGATDFVVGHYFNSPATVYPGVVRYDAGTGSEYFIDQTDGNGRNNLGTGSFAYQYLDFGRVADVYEAYLTAGTTYWFTLDLHDGPPADVAIYPGTPGGIYARYEHQGLGWPAGPQKRYLVYEATETDWHPVVVFRPETFDPAGIEYSLNWHPLDATGVPGDPPPPTKLALLAPSPNPFASSTKLAFDLPVESEVRIEIYDVRGRRINLIAAERLPAGRHEVAWTGRDDRGARVASGLYYARMVVGGKSMVRRMTVL